MCHLKSQCVSLFIALLVAAPSGAAADEPLRFQKRDEPASQMLLLQQGKLITKETTGKMKRAIPLGERYGQSPRLAHDPVRALVWMAGGGLLAVIDLREKDPKPTEIAQGLPAALTALRVTPIWSEGITQSGPAGYGDTLVELRWSQADARVSVDQLGHGDDEEASSNVKITGHAWLKSQQDRLPSKVMGHHELSKKPATKLPKGLAKCEIEEECGRSVPFLHQRWRLVVTEVSCGDGCYSGCHLLDTATGEIAQPPELKKWAKQGIEAGSCGPYQMATDGVHFVNDGQLCTVDKARKVECKPAPAGFVGWISGGIVGDL